MELGEISAKLQTIIDGYAKHFDIRRDDDWFILKLQEELGELAAAHLKLTRRGRAKGKTPAELEKNLEEEITDVIAMTLLFARHKGIDVEKAFEEKWFKYLKSPRDS